MISLSLGVPNPDDLLAALGAGALLRIERATTQLGTYAEIGTVAIVSETYSYSYLDTSAPAGAWYQTRYSAAGGSNPTAYSTPWQGDAASTTISSLQDVRRRMGIVHTDHKRDDLIQAFCQMATTEIHGYTGRRFLPYHATLTYNASSVLNNGRWLPVTFGVRAVTSLSVRYVTGGVLTLVDPKYYRLQPGDMDLPYGWPYTQIEMVDISPYRFNMAAYDCVVMEADLGWSAAPANIHEASTNAIVRALRAQQNGQADTVGNTQTGQSIILRQFSPAERDMLDWYRDRIYR